MICKNCGNNIEENERFCGKCGVAAEVQEVKGTPLQETKPQTSAQTNSFCSNCGAPKEENGFCGNCGASPDGTVRKAVAKHSAPKKTATSEKKKTPARRVIIILLLIIALLGAAIGGCAIYTYYQDNIAMEDVEERAESEDKDKDKDEEEKTKSKKSKDKDDDDEGDKKATPSPEPTEEPDPTEPPYGIGRAIPESTVEPEAISPIGKATPEAPVFTDAYANSELASQTDSSGNVNYYWAQNVLDNDDSTCWAMDTTTGKTPTITLSAYTDQYVSGVKFSNGYFKSESAYSKNRRITSVRISYNGGSKEYSCDSEQYGIMQNVVFDEPVYTSYIVLEVLSSTDATFDDLCISTIEVY